MKLLKLLFIPLVFLYYLFLKLRHCLYDIGLLKSYITEIKSVCVGNLQIGGTGKTPLIEYLILLLNNNKIAVLSRGYKRITSGFKWVSKDSMCEDVGDEALQIKNNNPNVLVAVSENRVTGMSVIEKEGTKLVLLDDAFQHRKIKAGLNIITTPFSDLFINDFLFPLGRLRDLKDRAKKADIIVVTKSPVIIPKNKKQKIMSQIKTCDKQEVYFSSLNYGKAYNIFNITAKVELKDFDAGLIVTGIAREEEFLVYIKSIIKKVKHLKFSNHHFYTKNNIDGIKKEFNYLSPRKKIIITTQKDSVRLIKYKEILRGITVIAIPVKVVFESKEFNKTVLNYAR